MWKCMNIKLIFLFNTEQKINRKIIYWIGFIVPSVLLSSIKFYFLLKPPYSETINVQYKCIQYRKFLTSLAMCCAVYMYCGVHNKNRSFINRFWCEIVVNNSAVKTKGMKPTIKFWLHFINTNSVNSLFTAILNPTYFCYSMHGFANLITRSPIPLLFSQFPFKILVIFHVSIPRWKPAILFCHFLCLYVCTLSCVHLTLCFLIIEVSHTNFYSKKVTRCTKHYRCVCMYNVHI